MLTAIDASTQALLGLGENPIQSFDDGTVEATIAGGLYPSVRDTLLSAHPWSFATLQVALPQLVTAPVADYAHAYQLPADFLRAISVGGTSRSGRGADYRIYGDHLHTNANPATLSYIYRVPEGPGVPPYFDDVLVAKLTAAFCRPLVESVSESEVLKKHAERALSRARLIDSQQQSPVALAGFALIEARR